MDEPITDQLEFLSNLTHWLGKYDLSNTITTLNVFLKQNDALTLEDVRHFVAKAQRALDLEEREDDNGINKLSQDYS